MKRYQIVLFGIALLYTEALFAQKYSRSGYVRDEGTGEALIGATVAAPELKTGTSTNTYGDFSLSLPAVGDSVTLVFAYVGYQSLAVRMQVVTNPEQLKINLLPDGNQLEEVVIKAHADNENVQRTAMSVINLPVSQIKAIPVIAGERDVLKAVQFLPGVSAVAKGAPRQI